MSLSSAPIHLLNTSRDGASTTSLGSLFQCFTTLSVKKFFLISNLNLPWCNLRPFPLLTTTSFQVAVEGDKVSPQTAFLQTEQRQFPQPVLTGLVLQTLHQPCSPSLDTLQHLSVFLVVRDPKLNTGFKVSLTSAEYQGTKHLNVTVPLSCSPCWRSCPAPLGLCSSALLLLPFWPEKFWGRHPCTPRLCRAWGVADTPSSVPPPSFLWVLLQQSKTRWAQA